MDDALDAFTEAATGSVSLVPDRRGPPAGVDPRQGVRAARLVVRATRPTTCGVGRPAAAGRAAGRRRRARDHGARLGRPPGPRHRRTRCRRRWPRSCSPVAALAVGERGPPAAASPRPRGGSRPTPGVASGCSATSAGADRTGRSGFAVRPRRERRRSVPRAHARDADGRGRPGPRGHIAAALQALSERAPDRRVAGARAGVPAGAGRGRARPRGGRAARHPRRPHRRRHRPGRDRASASSPPPPVATRRPPPTSCSPASTPATTPTPSSCRGAPAPPSA